MQENPVDRGTTMELETWDFHCDHCWQSYSIDNKTEWAENYFNGIDVHVCGDCHKAIDWWESTLKSIRKEDTSTALEICLPIGARKSVIQTTLRANQITAVDFRLSLIPEDSRVINIHYNATYDTPARTGTLQAVEIYQNPMFREVNPLGAAFYGIPHGTPPYPDANLVIGVTWVPNLTDESRMRLVDAFLYYLENRYHGALISANAAVEFRLGSLLTALLKRVPVGKGRIEDFLQSASTYSYQLNVLLPTFVSFTKGPVFPEFLRGKLNGLNRLRNDLAHGTIRGDAVGGDEAAQALCAAVFGLHYLNVVEPLLLTDDKASPKRKKPTKKKEKKVKGKKK